MALSNAKSIVSLTRFVQSWHNGLLCGTLEPEYSYWGRDFIYYNEHGAIGNVYENELAGPFIDAMNLRSNQKSFTAALPASWHAPEAAWRNMLFTQPPFIGQVDVHQRGCPPGKKKYATAPIRTAENCRLGSIAAALEDRYMSFAGRGWLSCEVEGWLKWEHVDENRQLEDVVRAE